MKMVRTPRRRAFRSLKQAIRDASDAPIAPQRYSCWRSTVFSDAHPEGDSGAFRHNLTTTTASGYTNAYDWLAKAMGAGESTTFATAVGVATATTATTLTNSGASFPTSGQGLAGQWVIAAVSTTVLVRGRINANTATQLTVDQWYSGTSTSGAAGSTPSATGAYIVVPGQTCAEWMAVTSSSFTPATSDTTLSGELTGSGFARAVGTYSHTAAASTYALTHTWTATATVTINNEAQFGACNPTAGGVMPFESAEPSPPTLVSGDTLQNTATITI